MSTPQDRTHVSSQVASAGGGAEVLLGVESVRVDHEVTVGQVAATHRGCKRQEPFDTFLP